MINSNQLKLIPLSLLLCAGFVVPPMEAATPGQPPGSPKLKPKYVVDQIIIKFNDNLEYCAECLPGSNKTFKSAVKNGHTKMDLLLKKYGVTSIDPVFRKSKIGKSKNISNQQSVSILKEEKKQHLAKINARYQRHTDIEQAPDLYHIYVIKLKKGFDVHKAVAEFSTDNYIVDFAEPNYIAEWYVTPDDPDYGGQWGFPMIEAEAAWDKFADPSLIGKGTIAAILDSGLLPVPDIVDNIWFNPGEFPGVDDNADGEVSFNEIVNHGLTDSPADTNELIDVEDLFASSFQDGVDNDGNGFADDFFGWDFTSCAELDRETDECATAKPRGNKPLDDSGIRYHGTHVAGTVAAVTNNNMQVAGTSWNTKIMALKIGYQAGVSVSDASAALVYASDNGADLVNMSWGFSGGDFNIQTRLFEYAVAHAITSGTVLIAAAGNDELREVYNLPAAFPDVISVGATNDQDQIAEFSTVSGDIEVSAPGEDILSLTGNMSGTSMASPHVVGVAALIMSYYDNLGEGVTRVEKVRRILRATVDHPQFTQNLPFGDGRVNARKALSYDLNDLVLARTLPIPETVSGSVEIRGTATGKDFAQYRFYYITYDLFTGEEIRNEAGPVYTAPVENGVLTTLDTMTIGDGFIRIELEVAQTTGSVFTHQMMLFIDNYSIYGRVEEITDFGERGLWGVSVRLEQNGQTKMTVTTNESGFYIFPAPLDAGTYDIVPSLAGYRFEPARATDVVYDPFDWRGITQGPPFQAFPIAPPTGSVAINSGQEYTRTLYVSLTIPATYNGAPLTAAGRMRFSNDGIIWSNPETYAGTKSWMMAPGDGDKTVYVQFSGIAEPLNWSMSFTDTIKLDSVKPVSTSSLGTSPAGMVRLNASTNDPAPGSGIVKIVYTIRQSKIDPNYNSMLYSGSASVIKTASGAPASFSTSTDVARTWFGTAGIVYTVTGYDVAGNALASGKYWYDGTRLVDPDLTAPGVPTGLTVVKGTGSGTANLSWDPSTDASGYVNYEIYRNGALIKSTARIVPTAGQKIAYTDTNLVAGVPYNYEVLARDMWSNKSAKAAFGFTLDPLAPTVPTNLAAYQYEYYDENYGFRAELSWGASTVSSGMVTYEVYRNNQKIATTSWPYFMDTGLAETTYIYKVRAVANTSHYSGFSNTATVTLVN